MNILVLGGTRFVGRHIVESLLARGHEVTLFHRGQTGADLFPSVNHVLGDRLVDLSALEGEWDAVIDTSAYIPRAVRMAAAQLAERAKFCLFISTISVYQDLPGISEDSPKIALADPTVETSTAETYGGLKVLCEEEVQEAWAGRCAIVRPGIIVGPEDYTDRFTYFPAKFASQEHVLVPKVPDTVPIQWIDGRDLAEFCVDLVEKSENCVVNAAGPFGTVSYNEFLRTCEQLGGAKPVHITLDQMEQHEVRPWADFPLLAPEGNLLAVSNQRAKELGLKLRPLADTIRDTLAWRNSLGNPLLRTGLDPEKEQELLQLIK